MWLPLFIGAAIAGGVGAFSRAVGFDRDRALYPVALVVIAWYYILFAAIDGSVRVLAVEGLAAAGFCVLAAVGFRRAPWIVAAGLVGHGLFDAVHGHIVANAAVPGWWPPFCAAADIGLGVIVMLQKDPRRCSCSVHLGPATVTR